MLKYHTAQDQTIRQTRLLKESLKAFGIDWENPFTGKTTISITTLKNEVAETTNQSIINLVNLFVEASMKTTFKLMIIVVRKREEAPNRIVGESPSGRMITMIMQMTSSAVESTTEVVCDREASWVASKVVLVASPTKSLRRQKSRSEINPNMTVIWMEQEDPNKLTLDFYKPFVSPINYNSPQHETMP